MISKAKKALKNIPFIKKIVCVLRPGKSSIPAVEFVHSGQYWEDRYAQGGTSGAGSYGRLAQFKAEFLNEFVAAKNITSVVEFGCGDGAQLGLAEYPSYVGFDVSPQAVKLCAQKFSGNGGYEFHSLAYSHPKEGSFDLALSLDVIYHLIEDDVFDGYMKRLFSASDKYVIIYSYNFEKNYFSKHEKGREFLGWCQGHAKNWTLIEQVKQRYPYNPEHPNNTSQSDFYVFKKQS
jgi:SAM-dependent methyltransferase